MKDYSEIQSGGQIGEEELYSLMTKDTLLQNKFDTSINLLSVNILSENELSIKELIGLRKSERKTSKTDIQVNNLIYQLKEEHGSFKS